MLDIIYFLISLCAFFLAKKFLQVRNDYKEEAVYEFVEERLVTVEKVTENNKSVWLVFSCKDNQFLAQGNSEKEAIDNLLKLFPNKEFFQLTEKI
jgi:hypothetical protein